MNKRFKTFYIRHHKIDLVRQRQLKCGLTSKNLVQVGKSVEESCWRKAGICGVVSVWESIRMEMSRGSLLFSYAGMNNVFGIL